MRDKPNLPEKSRIRMGLYGSDESSGCNGAFLVIGPRGKKLQIIASNGCGWEHVSLCLFQGTRCPTWDEMCWVKDLFWDEEETVIQYHPPKSQYVNTKANVLHLWKPIGVDIPVPPGILVGIPGLEIRR